MGRGPSPENNNKTLWMLANQMGIDTDKYYEDDNGSQGYFDRDALKQDIENAYSNDYDVRRSLEAASLAGEDVPTSIGSIEDAFAAHEFLQNTHSEHLNRGGNFSSNSDYAGVTDYWVNEDRSVLKNGFSDDLNGLKDSLLEQALGKKKEKEANNNQPIEPSARLGGARQRLRDASNNPVNLYSKNNNNVSRTDEQADATRHFFDEEKISFAEGLNLQNDIFNNLQNAANTVTNIYGR